MNLLRVTNLSKSTTRPLAMTIYGDRFDKNASYANIAGCFYSSLGGIPWPSIVVDRPSGNDFRSFRVYIAESTVVVSFFSDIEN